MPKHRQKPVYLSLPAAAELERVRGVMRTLHPSLSLSQAVELLVANWFEGEATPEWVKWASSFEFQTKTGRPRGRR